ncbi:MAG TPA: hypothetical protein VMV79_03045 [Alphaproteobacteria bacterium]|nr:hypothetical protein [Alphaproteobacteria bacterium]
MYFSKFLPVAVLALSLSAFGTAHAKTATGTDPLSGLTPLSSGTLQDYAGGWSVLNNNSSASVAQNITGNSIGNVGFTGGVFGNSVSGNSGLTTLIANSGNQVSIAQSTVVNVFLH